MGFSGQEYWSGVPLPSLEGGYVPGYVKGWLDGIIVSVDMNLNKFWEIVKDTEAWHATVHLHAAKC